MPADASSSPTPTTIAFAPSSPTASVVTLAGAGRAVDGDAVARSSTRHATSAAEHLRGRYRQRRRPRRSRPTARSPRSARSSSMRRAIPWALPSTAPGDVYVDRRRRPHRRVVAGRQRARRGRVAAGVRGRRRRGGEVPPSFGGLAVAAPGRLIVADAGNALVRLVVRPIADRASAAAVATDRPALRCRGVRVAAAVVAARSDAGAARDCRHARRGARRRGQRALPRRDRRARGRRDAGPRGARRRRLGARPRSRSSGRSTSRFASARSPTCTCAPAGRRRGPVFDETRFAGSYDETGALIGIRVKRGARFATGDVVGTVNAFNHVHLNVGWPAEEHNPLLLRLVQFEDTVPPTIPRGGVRVYDENGQPFKQRVKGRLVVRGRVQIVVDAWDQVDGNAKRRRLGLFRLGYQVLGRRRRSRGGIRVAARLDRVQPALDGAGRAARRVTRRGVASRFTAAERRAFCTPSRIRSTTAWPPPVSGIRAICRRARTRCAFTRPTCAAMKPGEPRPAGDGRKPVSVSILCGPDVVRSLEALRGRPARPLSHKAPLSRGGDARRPPAHRGAQPGAQCVLLRRA